MRYSACNSSVDEINLSLSFVTIDKNDQCVLLLVKLLERLRQTICGIIVHSHGWKARECILCLFHVTCKQGDVESVFFKIADYGFTK